MAQNIELELKSFLDSSTQGPILNSVYKHDKNKTTYSEVRDSLEKLSAYFKSMSNPIPPNYAPQQAIPMAYFQQQMGMPMMMPPPHMQMLQHMQQ